MEDFFFRQDWTVKDAVADVILLERWKKGSPLIERSKRPFEAQSTPGISIDGRFQLLNVQMDTNSFGRRSVLPLTFWWKSLEDLKEDYQMVLILKKGSKVIYAHPRRIGYTILPTSTWFKEVYLKERYWFLLPPLEKGEYALAMTFYNIDTGKKAGMSFSSQNLTQKGEMLQIGYLNVP